MDRANSSSDKGRLLAIAEAWLDLADHVHRRVCHRAYKLKGNAITCRERDEPLADHLKKHARAIENCSDIAFRHGRERLIDLLRRATAPSPAGEGCEERVRQHGPLPQSARRGLNRSRALSG